jgi:hypothetical protein
MSTNVAKTTPRKKNKTSQKNQKKKNEKLYAGPTFQNSPAPSALPVPTFSMSVSPSVSASFGHISDSGKSARSEPVMEREEVIPSQQEDMFVMDEFMTESAREPSKNLMQFLAHGNHVPPPHVPFAYHGFHFSHQYPIPHQLPAANAELDQMSKNLKNVLGL